MRVILGIDPGSLVTGFASILTDGNTHKIARLGVIKLPGEMSLNNRLGVLQSELGKLFDQVNPDVTVIEKIFLGQSADSAFKLGHARGLAVATAVNSGSQVLEYATRLVKKGITGNGNASKDQVKLILTQILNLTGSNDRIPFDATDALALAYYQARVMDVTAAWAKQPARPKAEGEIKG